MAQVTGLVVNAKGYTIDDAILTFFQKQTSQTATTRSGAGGDFRAEVLAGPNVVVTVAEGYVPEVVDLDVPAGGLTNLLLTPQEAPPGSPALSPPTGVDLPDEVEDLLTKLDEPRFSLDAPVSLFEANQAVGLFAVVNLMLAGQGRIRLGDEERMDMLGVLTLFYRLSDKSLADRLVVQNTDELWRDIEDDLKALAQQVDQLQVDVEFLAREGKRQFNLGTSNDVLANTEFPPAFDRYVDLAAQPALALNLQLEERSEFSDKLQLQEAYDVLRDLKGVILEVVRMLSRYGTAATRRVNEDWANFHSRALDVLAKVAEKRVTQDLDEMTAINVVAVLTGKRREDLIPQFALAKHGTKLLRLAIEIYLQTIKTGTLDAFDRDHLRDLFQGGNQEAEFFTTRLRREADILRRHQIRLT
jgi:hypothetical protein